MVDYLQYIGSVSQNNRIFDNVRFLVSGADTYVRQIVGQNIIASCQRRRKVLFVLDNTRNFTEISNFGSYHVINFLNGEVSLCGDILEVSSLKAISRMRSLLADLGFDGTHAMKIVSYLSFVKETERRLGNCGTITVETLEEYSSTSLVKWKLCQLVDCGKLTKENYEYLLCRYGEVSSAAADFEMFLVLFAPFLGSTKQPEPDMAIHLPVGEFESDKPMQEMMCKLMMSYVKQHCNSSAILIIDDGRGNRSHIIDILKTLPTAADIHMLTNDAFSFGEADLSVVMNTFPVRIYTRHEDMASCSKIESCCGQIDVVKKSYTTSIDKRFRANSAWDLLLGTNRTETEIRNATVQESRYRKEMISSLSSGTGIIDCGGNQVLFQF